MVNITKWVLLGGSLILLGLFTKEAAATSLTGTLHRAGMAGGSVGGALTGIGSGIGDVFRGLLTPLWEVGNFAKSFGFGAPNISGQGYSTSDPQSNQERIFLTGQGGGFDDAEQQGGGDTGVNTDPIGDRPNWFSFPSLPPAAGIFDVGGSDIQISKISWGNGTLTKSLPLSQQARSYYANLGVDVRTATQSQPTGGGSNSTTGGGGGSGSGVSFSSSGHSGRARGGGFGAAN
jgi:hypothetical protein